MTEISRHRASSRLVNVGDELEQYTAQADRLAAEGDYAALGDGLGRLRELRKTLSRLERHVEDLLVPLLPSKRVVLPGIVGMERHGSTSRKQWQSEAILRELYASSWVDENGVGRTAGEAAEVFLEAVQTCVPLTASLGWRVKALADYGLDPDEYCEATPGRTTVQVWRPDDA